MNRKLLLNMLPAFHGKKQLISKEQDVLDIIKEVCDSHIAFANDYDKISSFFDRGNELETSKALFDFCKNNFEYKQETEESQTTRPPAGILSTGKIVGVDCKHYAGFIAGVLDSIKRKTGQPIKWKYRFSSYNMLDPSPQHVFVVLGDGENETWVDPVLDYYDSRSPYPWYSTDKKINTMSLYRMNGVHNIVGRKIQSSTTAYRGDIENSVCVNGTKKMSGFFDFLDSIDLSSIPSGDSSGSSGGSLVTAGLDTVVPGAGAALTKAISLLGNNSVTDFLKAFTKDPGTALLNLIKGRKYTFGDYALAEIYARNILGDESIQSRQDPRLDNFVAQAWAFFTTALGVRVRTNDDLDMLVQSGTAYLTRNTSQNGDISQKAADRASRILIAMPRPRDQKWNVGMFNNEPYIYPLPFVTPGSLFNGVHPVTGQTFVNGYPNTYTGDTYPSQIATVPTGKATGAGASLLSSGNSLPILLGGGLLATIVFSGHKKKSIHGIPKNYLLWGAAAVGAYLFLVPKTVKAPSAVPSPVSLVPNNTNTLPYTPYDPLSTNNLNAV
jgi:hypothetical protein